MSRVVVMGSGETAPTMVRTHRAVLADTFPDGSPGGAALVLDTTFGFQDNADELVGRTLQYFEQAVGRPVGVAPWRRASDGADAEKTLALLEQARWLFAGPGSPTYALRHWRGTGVAAAMLDVVRREGTLVVGSAAACTVGSHAVPVYEVYKAGADLHWADGLDVLGDATGVRAALVPHFDNAEGGTYDTRYCYLGAKRLAAMEALLPDDVGVLGVDEHTALLLDLPAGTATVRGNGVVTLRHRDREVVLTDGQVVDTGWLADVVAGRGPAEPGAAPPVSPASRPVSGGEAAGQPDDAALPVAATSLRAAVDAERERFDAAMAAPDVDAAVAAVLAVEQAMQDWLTDSLQSDDRDHARRVLRAMVVRLGDLARTGARDPREVVGGYVDLLLGLRARARGAKDFATSDAVRDGLTGLGVEVRDTPDGVDWVLRPAAATS